MVEECLNADGTRALDLSNLKIVKHEAVKIDFSRALPG